MGLIVTVIYASRLEVRQVISSTSCHYWQEYIISRAYRAAEGGERACNSRTSCIEGESGGY